MSGLRSFSKESQVHKTFGASTISDLSFINSESFTQVGSPRNSSIDLETNLQNFGAELESLSSVRSYSVAPLKSEQVELRWKNCQHFHFYQYCCKLSTVLRGVWCESNKMHYYSGKC